MSSPQEPNLERNEKLSQQSTVAEFAAHYQRAYPRLTAVAAGVLGRQEGAEDIVQDAAGLAAAKGKQFASPGAFVAWMIGVVRRCALNERRKTQRRRTYATDPSEIAGVVDRAAAEPLPIDPASGELVAGQASFEDRLQTALETLSDDARCCLLLRSVHDLSYAEIAELLGIPRGPAMSHVHRSRQQLRQRLASAETACDPNSTSHVSLPDETS
jgi:RNA polymerase sigma-70 factor, ECF subfamily